MKPIKFKGHNVVFAENQDEYQDLPALQQGDAVTFCLKLSEEEIQEISTTGVLWHTVLTFGRPLQPQTMDCSKPDHVRHAEMQAPSKDRLTIDDQGIISLDGSSIGAWVMEDNRAICYLDDEDIMNKNPSLFFANIRLGEQFEKLHKRQTSTPKSTRNKNQKLH